MAAKRTQVLVCAGTGCTIGNSGELITEFEKEIKSLGLDNEIEVLRTGCLGLCGVGPNISIYPDNIIYKSVQVSDVKEIVMEHLYKGRPVHRLMLNESDEDTREIHDINDTKFYHKQRRIALHNCGVIDPENIKDVIGRGGDMITKIILEASNVKTVNDKDAVKVDLEDDGRVIIYHTDKDIIAKTRKMIEDVVREVEEGKIYTGKVVKVEDFGAFVELWPGCEGLVHVSQLDYKRVEKPSDVVAVGDEIMVKSLGYDNRGRLNLSRKECLPKPEKKEKKEKKDGKDDKGIKD